MHLLGGCNHPFGNHIALHDATENIHQNRFEVGVFEHDFKSFGDFFSTRATTHIEEIRWFTAVEFNRVHGRHCQTRAIDQTTNIAIQ